MPSTQQKSLYHGTTYDEAKAFYARYATRTFANNTFMVSGHWRDGGQDYGIRLHYTEIITYHVSGAITFDNGGWATPTTARRMSQFSPHSVYVRKGSMWLAPFGNHEVAPILISGKVTIGRNGSELNPAYVDAVIL